jgi:hypothetical protein
MAATSTASTEPNAFDLNDTSSNLLRNNSTEEWVAIKSLKESDFQTDNCNILNIVSISVEKEKIILVSRDHNRLVSDDESTKQWYGIYSVEEFYRKHKQMLQLDQNLDQYYPDKLRPIKGYLFTYFLKDLTKAIDKTNLANYSLDLNNLKYLETNIINDHDSLNEIDLQDNDLCESIKSYLAKAFKSLGRSLYVDILFNDIDSDDYFEIYSDFNLKRLHSEIEKLKIDLFQVNPHFLTTKNSSSSCINSMISKKLNLKSTSSKSTITNASLLASQMYLKEQQDLFEQQLFQFNLKRLMDAYQKEDAILDNLLKIYAEYYNNLTKPLNDSKELIQRKMKKYETKLNNQEKSMKLLTGQAQQSAIESISHLKQQINSFKNEINNLINNIDSNYIEFKQSLVDLYMKLLEKIQNDKKKIMPSTNSKQLTSIFNILTQDRVDLIVKEIEEKKFQMYSLQLKILERNKKEANTSINQSNDLTYSINSNISLNSNNNNNNELQLKIVNLKFQLLSEEENLLKKELNKLKSSLETKYLDVSLQNAIKEFELNLDHELKDTYKTYFNNYLIKRDLQMSEDNVKTCYMISESEEDFIKEDSSSEDEYDDSKFQDAVEDPETLIQEEDKFRKTKLAEINVLKKKILNIGSKKSALRLTLVKLFSFYLFFKIIIT